MENKERIMLVYLDNCCYNRPFDEQSQLDYTEWQKKYFANASLEKFNREATEYDKLNPVTVRQIV
jgi:hypothetical protein